MFVESEVASSEDIPRGMFSQHSVVVWKGLQPEDSIGYEPHNNQPSEMLEW